MKCFVLGSGTWGTALAWLLRRKGNDVVQWCRRRERAEQIRGGHHPLLPGVDLGPGMATVVGAESPGTGFDLALSVIPTQYLAETLEVHAASLPRGMPWVSASKGLERQTLRLPSRILFDAGLGDVAVLSGPSHAEEVVRDAPTAVVVAHRDEALARRLQEDLSCGKFRVYSNTDVCGVEWGGVLKNIIALASGIAIGYGFGDNTLAALVTRGAVEMARLGEALGGRRESFNGLSGIGDLMVTCFSEHSRNRGFGIRIGRGESPQEILRDVDHVVEGVPTTEAVVQMCRQLGVEMPIAEEVHEILQGKSIEEGVRALLGRSLKEE